MASEASDQTTFSSLFMPFLLGFAAMQQEQESGSRVVLINPLVVQSMAVIGVGHGPSAKDGPPPASEAAIEALRAVEADEERSECTICLEGWEAGKEMPCGHRFHGDCIERWLRIHGSCPVCRFRLLPTRRRRRRGRNREVGSRVGSGSPSPSISEKEEEVGVIHQLMEHRARKLAS